MLRNCQLSGVISSNLALPNIANLVYSLNGGVRVGKDVGGAGNLPGGQAAILTIDPGVVVFGSSGSDFLLVERGSRILAEGTRTRPIIFTSRQNIVGTSSEQSIGQWGGLVMLGRAPISRCLQAGATGGTVDCENRIEGADGLYGGATAGDDSGTLRFVQIRYAGFEVTPGNELNSLTLGGIGTGTEIEYVQVHNGSDDGIEWFGGTVNGRYLIATGNDDDSFDTDFGYRGFNQFMLGTQRVTSGSGSHVIESDSSGQDALRPRSRPTFANFTFLHRSTAGSNASTAVMYRGGTDFNMLNGIIDATTAGCVEFREQTTIAAPNAGAQKAGPPNFLSVHLQCAGGPAIAGSGVTQAETLDRLTNDPQGASRGNTLNGTNGLANTIFRGAGVTATPINPTSFSSFLQNAAYIGAFRDENDTWFSGWSCSSGAAFFTPAGVAPCTASPLPIQP